MTYATNDLCYKSSSYIKRNYFKLTVYLVLPNILLQSYQQLKHDHTLLAISLDGRLCILVLPVGNVPGTVLLASTAGVAATGGDVMLATGGATAASYRQQNERKRCSLNWSGILLNEMMPCSLVHGRPILCCWQPAMGTTWAQQCGSNNVAARDDEQQCVRKCKQLQLHYIPSTTLAVKGPEETVRGLITTRACLTGGFSHIVNS